MCKVSVVDVYVTYVKFLAKNEKVCLGSMGGWVEM